MISILSLMLLLSFIKLMIEDSLLLILLSMEMVSMLCFFTILSANTQSVVFTSCTITILTIMISEGVLSLTVFISLMRASGTDKITSLSLSS